MPTRTLLSLLSLLLLAVMMGCPAFGPDGSIPMALHRDMVNLHKSCYMSASEWMDKCGDDYWDRSSVEKKRCPRECQPAKPQRPRE